MLISVNFTTIGSADRQFEVPLELRANEIARVNRVSYSHERVTTGYQISMAMAFTAQQTRLPAITTMALFLTVSGLFAVRNKFIHEETSVGFFVDDLTYAVDTDVEVGMNPFAYVLSTVDNVRVRVELDYSLIEVSKAKKLAVIGESGWVAPRTLQTQ